MEERTGVAISQMLNETKHLRRFTEVPSPFKGLKKGSKQMSNGKPLMKGQFLTFSKMLKQFRPFYFELQPGGWLVKYQDKTKAPPVESLECQLCTVNEENEVAGDQVAFGIILSNSEEGEMAKLVTEKFANHKTWMKALKKICRLPQFLNRFKVEQRAFDHFYRCIDKKKRMYTSVKIVNKKGLKQEQKKFVNNEISLLRRVQCNLLPKIKKVYEDESYIYLTFAGFTGDDLLKIACSSSLEEIAVATLTYHILKGLRSLHSQGVFHGNLKLENIIFSTGSKENEIFLINFKYLEESTELYRERLIKRGLNNYVAPEILKGGEVTSQIDIFALGVCLFYMLFKKFPYKQIQRIDDSWKYELDLTVLTSMLDEKKKDPSSNHLLSVSGIDFLMKLLLEDPELRPTTSTALNHHWFINFTNKPTQNVKLQKFKEAHQMTSLKTILECSEMSDREGDSNSKLFLKKHMASNLSTFSLSAEKTPSHIFNSQHLLTGQGIVQDSILNKSNQHINQNSYVFFGNFSTKNIPSLKEEIEDNQSDTQSHNSDEVNEEGERVVENLMHRLDKISHPKKFPSSTERRLYQGKNEFRMTSPLDDDHVGKNVNLEQIIEQNFRPRSLSTQDIAFRNRDNPLLQIENEAPASYSASPSVYSSSSKQQESINSKLPIPINFPNKEIEGLNKSNQLNSNTSIYQSLTKMHFARIRNEN